MGITNQNKKYLQFINKASYILFRKQRHLYSLVLTSWFLYIAFEREKLFKPMLLPSALCFNETFPEKKGKSELCSRNVCKTKKNGEQIVM